MTKRIFRSMILVAGSILVASLMLIFGVLYSYFNTQLYQELKSEADYVARAVEAGGTDYLEQIKNSGKRFTLIRFDGTVLYDNQAEIKKMENHANREEIRGAMENGSGEGSRYSYTLSEKTMYYAVRLENGNILRVARQQETVFTLLLGIAQPILYILVAMFFLGAFFARRVANHIVNPINALDLEHPEKNEAYDEIAPLLTKIYRQKQTIQEQILDITRKQKEFAMITENMEEGFLVIDKRTEILSFNSSIKRLFGQSKVDNNKSVLTLNRSEAFRKTVEGALSGRHEETEIQVEDCKYQLVANPVFQGEEHEVVGAVLTLMDVTERQQMEQLRQEFTANVSHELKTPLTSISGFAEIMEGGMVKAEDIPKFAGNIFRESQRLISLVNDIIKLSQLDEGIMPYEREEVDLFQSAKEILGHLEEVAIRKKVKLSLEGEAVVLLLVRSVFEEIVYNLCDNAVKYNKENGIVILSIEKMAHQVALSVKDTGIGIPVSSQSHVFERFYRVDKSHSKEIGGTGLGLSIVKHGAAYLGASIRMESIVGEGTCITLLFPY